MTGGINSPGCPKFTGTLQRTKQKLFVFVNSYCFHLLKTQQLKKKNNNNNTNASCSQTKTSLVFLNAIILCLSCVMENRDQSSPGNQCTPFCLLFFLTKCEQSRHDDGLVYWGKVQSNAVIGKGSGWISSFAATQVVGSSFCWNLFGCGACPMTVCLWGESNWIFPRAEERLGFRSTQLQFLLFYFLSLFNP